jgi:competence protein ComEC
MKTLQFPISRITLFFILGIIIAHYFDIPILLLFSLSVTIFCVTAFFGIKTNKQFEAKSSFGISLYFLFILIGITSYQINKDNLKTNHYSHQETNFTKNHQLKFIILEKLRNTASNYRFIAKIIQIDNQKTNGKVLINLKKENTSLPIEVGSKLMIKDRLVKNFKPNNPDQFDYGYYLETKNIFAQVFTKASQIKISSSTQKDIWYYAANFRNTVIHNIANSGFKKEELAVVIALLLGQQQDISPDIMRDYQYAGAVHILSVSGLHVGFILFFIGFLLKPLPNNKLGNSIRLVIIFGSLWIFAIIAGLAPCVVRSATMFSFIAIGMFLNKETNHYHNLLLSLFTILLFQPQFLFDIGFQLSYIAVFFILWLEPMLKSIWKPKYKVVKYFWEILTVSFAAQIGTLPLSIYYFHQFPGLFFLTNIVLIPALTIIMFLGLVLIILAAFNCIPDLLAKLVEICITLMNDFINWIAAIEAFIIKEIPLSFSLLVVSYFFIISCIVWFKKPNFTKLAITLSSLLLFQLLFFGTNWSNQNKTELLVFNVTKKTIIAQRSNSKINLFTSDSLRESSFENKMLLSYATANYCSINSTQKLSNTMSFNNHKILIIDSHSIYKTSIKPDIIILRESPKLNLERLINEIRPKVIIADASNYKAYINQWKLSCNKLKIPFHSTYEKGYYSLK